MPLKSLLTYIENNENN